MSELPDCAATRLMAAENGGNHVTSVAILTIRPGHPRLRPDVFAPPTDVYETAGSVTIRMEIAGAVVSQISVVLDPDRRRVLIRGQRHDPAGMERRRYHNLEIQCGDFGRDVILPVPVDAGGAVATYHDGFLVVHLPKCPECPPKSRSIRIE